MRRLASSGSAWPSAVSLKAFAGGSVLSLFLVGTAYGFNRPANPPAPDSTDTALVTRYGYDAAGYQHEVTDNAGTVTRTEYDALGRPRKVIENVVDGSPETGDADEDRTTLYAYNAAGQITEQTADLNDFSPGGGGDQATHYIYSEELASPTSGGPVPAHGLLRAVVYPDALEDGETRAGVIGKLNSGTPGDFIETTYYADGALRTRTDQRGVRLTYHYNDDGTRRAQVASNFDAETDDSVRSMTYTYDDQQRLLAVRSHSSAQTSPTSADVVNQVTQEYTGLGQLAKQSQDLAPDSLPAQDILYAYDTTSSGGAFTKALRQTSVTYPNGRVLHTLYDAPGNFPGAAPGSGGWGAAAIDDALSRPNGLANAAPGSPGTPGETLVAYAHTGTGTTVAKDLPRIATRLDHAAQVAGDDPNDYLPGLDRFGRVTRLRWDRVDPLTGNPLAGAAGTSDGPLFDLRHGYDRAGNRRYTQRRVYGDQEELYGHDQLHRLTRFDKGGLNATQDAMASLGFAQDWALDALGNWNAFKQDDDGGTALSPTPDPYDLDQTRMHNAANEILSLAGGAAPAGGTGPIDQSLDPEGRIVIEAEDYDTITTANGIAWVEQSITGSDWIEITPGNDSLGAAPGPEGVATYHFNVPAGEDGDYIVWGLTSAPTAGDNSFWVRMNGGAWVKWYVPVTTAFRWDDVHDTSNGSATQVYSLAAGSHTLEIAYREDGTRLDLLYFTKNGDTPIDRAQSGSGFTLEAEDADTFGNQWLIVEPDATASASGGSAMQALPDIGSVYNSTYVTDSPRLSFNVSFEGPGTYYVWVRGRAIDGPLRPNSDSLHMGLDGQAVATADRIHSRLRAFGWESTRIGNGSPRTRLDIPAAGLHTVDVWMREDGQTVDRILLTQDASYVPTGFGPASTPRAGSGSGGGGGGVMGDPEYDATGNLVRMPLPGRPGGGGWTTEVKAVYDAWNRLVEVVDDRDHQNPLPLSTMTYDGLGRRITKRVTNPIHGELDFTYHYYYDGQRLIETHNGTGLVIKQHVWGLDYISTMHPSPDDGLRPKRCIYLIPRFF
ncbi:MAG: hypothetical protein AAGG38_10165, partial [Planctomycetota bacterium]